MIAGLVLAGGQSSRMGGGDKPLLELAGRPLLARILDRFSPQVGTLALNANGDPARFSAFDLDVVPDTIIGFAGPLAGILAGLEWAQGIGNVSHLATVAGDTPFLPRDLVARLAVPLLGDPGRIALAASGGRRHHVVGLWPLSARPTLAAFLANSESRKVGDFADLFGAIEVDFAPVPGFAEPFFNINTPDDMAEATRLAEASGQRVFGITGWKNSGKTTLTEKLVAEFTSRGLRVSTVKHAHHDFDIDKPGTDSFRHRAAGAGEVAIVSQGRWALMHELRAEEEPSLDQTLARLGPCDLVLVEGYKREHHRKIEARRLTARDTAPLAAGDPSIVAVAADHAVADTSLPSFALDDVAAIADFIAMKVGLHRR